MIPSVEQTMINLAPLKRSRWKASQDIELTFRNNPPKKSPVIRSQPPKNSRTSDPDRRFLPAPSKHPLNLTLDTVSDGLGLTIGLDVSILSSDGLRLGLRLGLNLRLNLRLDILLGAAAAALGGLGRGGVGRVGSLALSLWGRDGGGGFVIAISVSVSAGISIGAGVGTIGVDIAFDLDGLELLAGGPEALVRGGAVLEAGELGKLFVVGLFCGRGKSRLVAFLCRESIVGCFGRWSIGRRKKGGKGESEREREREGVFE